MLFWPWPALRALSGPPHARAWSRSRPPAHRCRCSTGGDFSIRDAVNTALLQRGKFRLGGPLRRDPEPFVVGSSKRRQVRGRLTHYKIFAPVPRRIPVLRFLFFVVFGVTSITLEPPNAWPLPRHFIIACCARCCTRTCVCHVVNEVVAVHTRANLTVVLARRERGIC